MVWSLNLWINGMVSESVNQQLHGGVIDGCVYTDGLNLLSIINYEMSNDIWCTVYSKHVIKVHAH